MGGTLGWGFPDGSVVKNPPANAGDAVLIPGLETSPGEGNGNPLQYSCLENPMDVEAWWAGVAKSRTRLSDFTHSAFFMVQLSHLYMTTGKTIALTTHMK